MTLNFSRDRSFKIKELLDNKKYPVDYNYQREPGAWSREDEQYFIDSILKKIQIPKIYLHKKRNKYYIVDGQQRIETIRFFINGKKGERKKVLRLSSDITGRKEDITFKKLKKNEQKRILNYRITASVIKRGSDEEVRELFRRLQRGKPLTEGEKLNAMQGNIVRLMRKLTDHDFFKKSLISKDKRHKFYHIAAVFLYIEDKIDDTNFKNIEKFFQKNKPMRKDDKIFRSCWRTLNFISKVFKHNDQPSSNLGWLTSIYLFSRDLGNYGLLGKCSYREIYDYLESFYNIIYDERRRKADYKRFYDMIHAATNIKKNIRGRREILIKYFTEGFNVHLKDEKRLFSSTKDRKMVYSRANGKCQYLDCNESNRKIEFNEKFDIHHRKLHATGARSKYKNARLVHPDCHHTIHRNMKLKRIR